MYELNTYYSQQVVEEFKAPTVWDTGGIVYYPEILCSIFPNKQKDVKKILDLLYLKEVSPIKEVYVFGSAVTYRSSIDSDLDIGIWLDYASANLADRRKIENTIYDLFRETGIDDLDIHFIRENTNAKFLLEVLYNGKCIFNSDSKQVMLDYWESMGISPRKQMKG